MYTWSFSYSINKNILADHFMFWQYVSIIKNVNTQISFV